MAREPESRRVWETRLGSHPSWRALRHDQGSTYHCTEDGGALLTPPKFLVVSFACELSLDFPSSINGHCNTHPENHPERRDTTARQAQIQKQQARHGQGVLSY